MYANTDSTSAGTFTHTRTSTSNTYYGYLRGFNFNDVPANATVSSFTVKIKASATGHTTSTSTSYYMSLYNNTTAISNTNASGRLTTSTTTFTFSNGSMSWSTLKGYGNNFGIRIPLRRQSSSTADVVSVYGAEILVEYTAETVHVTGVTLNKSTASVEVGETEQLTATVAPANATDKSVSWSSSNTSVATVDQSGLVTAVASGTARITVKTTDGNYTAYCDITVPQQVLTEYVLTNTMKVGKSYLVANASSGTAYLMSNVSGGSRQLQGVAVTVTNNRIQIPASVESKCLFECVQTVQGNSVTTSLSSNGNYLYCDNSSGLRFQSTGSLDRFWHYNNHKFWQFKNTSSDGYDDTSSEYKYYLEVNSSHNFTDNHVTTTSIEDSNLPAIYLFELASGTSDSLFFKQNGSWIEATKAYKKVNGSWVEQSDLTTVFQSGTKYIKGN